MHVFTPVVCVFVTVIVSPERRHKPFITAVYNMVCTALFLQRALYTVHCTNIMHSTTPSFVITPAVFSSHCKSLFCIYAEMKYATFY